jgi:hypothetical protein
MKKMLPYIHVLHDQYSAKLGTKERKGIMQKKTNTIRDIIVVGFALFSMFFGAGNVIFPPYLGMEAGPQ